MELPRFVGVLSLVGYPKLDLFEEITVKMDRYEMDNFYEDLKYKIRMEYVKYISHIVASIFIAGTFFILGYLFYVSIFPVSVVFSLLFIVTFIHLSKAQETKQAYFAFFKLFFLHRFARTCTEKEHIEVLSKKKKTLIYIVKE